MSLPRIFLFRVQEIFRQGQNQVVIDGRRALAGGCGPGVRRCTCTAAADSFVLRNTRLTLKALGFQFQPSIENHGVTYVLEPSRSYFTMACFEVPSVGNIADFEMMLLVQVLMKRCIS